LERGRRKVGRGLRPGEEGKIVVAHLYRATTRAGTNLLTFVPGGATTQYKCEVFVLGGWEMAPTRPCERAFVPGSGSIRYKCSYFYRGQKYPVQMKNRAWDKCAIL
jgi:hypothetical protein